jgi:hypothetical protein
MLPWLFSVSHKINQQTPGKMGRHWNRVFHNAILACPSTSLHFLDTFNLRLGLTFSSFATRYKINTIDSFLPCILHTSGFFGAAMAQSVQRRATGRTAEVRLPEGIRDFSLLHRVQTSSGASPASYSVGSVGSFPGGKAAGARNWPLTSN